jgi:hypothetical protein
MNFKTSTLIILIAVLSLVLYSCTSKTCDEMNKDYINLNQEIEKNLSISDSSTIDYVIAENSFYDKYKLDELFNIIKNYSGDNIGMKMILSKLFIHKNDFEKALVTLDAVLKSYPKHPEALYLKEKVQELSKLEIIIINSDSQLPQIKDQYDTVSKELNDAIAKSKKPNDVKAIGIKLANIEEQMMKIKPSTDEKIQKAIILRELLFPDKALNVLSSLVPKYATNKVWYEIALSFLYYDNLIGASYQQPNDPIVKEIKNIMSIAGGVIPPMFKTSRIIDGKETPAENSCMDYFSKIIMYLSNNKSNLSSFLSDDEIKEIGNQKDSGGMFPGGNMGAFFYLLGKSIDKKLNPIKDSYFSRKYASCLYVLKKDAGDGFKNIAQLAKKCDFNGFGKRDSKQGPNIKIIQNEITDSIIKINLIDLFAILQKNYLNVSGWKGPYLAIPKDNPWAYDYVYYEDKTNNVFGIMSTGPNMVFDNFGKIGNEDAGFLMSF